MKSVEGIGWFPVILVIVLFAYLDSLTYGFLSMDDPEYVYENPHVQTGLSVENVKWSFSSATGGGSYWHPLTWLSHQLDCSLFGLNAGRHHATNLIFHLLAVMAIAGLGQALGLTAFQRAVVICTFALHPVQVESVVWIAERKNLLSGGCILLALSSFLYYLRRSDKGALILCFCSGVLGMMAKPSAVVIPVALLILWVWFRRFESKDHDIKLDRNSLFLLAGLFLCSTLVAFVTVWAQREVGALVGLGELGLAGRLDRLWFSYVWGMWHFIYPVDLSIAYSYGGEFIGRVGFCGGLGVILLSYLAWRHSDKRGLVFLGWFLYLLVMLPSSGIVQVGMQSFADRYLYLGVMALSLVVVGLGSAFKGISFSFFSRAAILAFLVGVMVWQTRINTGKWRDSVTLFRSAADRDPDNWFVVLGLGAALLNVGEDESALHYVLKARELNANSDLSSYLLALCYVSRDDSVKALEALEEIDGESLSRYQELSEQLKFQIAAEAGPSTQSGL